MNLIPARLSTHRRLCNGCFNAMDEIDGDHPCPFCRNPNVSTSDEEEVRRLEALKENGNEVAIYQLGEYYDNGSHGLQQNWAKANELYLMAGELGYTDAYFNLACNYGRYPNKIKHCDDSGLRTSELRSCQITHNQICAN